MEKLIFSVYDHNTGNVETREATPEEKSIYEKSNAEFIANQKEANDKQNARASALAKLAKLGLTEDEINAL